MNDLRGKTHSKKCKKHGKKEKNFADIKIIHTFAVQYRGVEQLVARRAHNPEAGGSSPSPMPQLLSSQRVAALITKRVRQICAKNFFEPWRLPRLLPDALQKKNGHQRKIHVDFRWRGRWIRKMVSDGHDFPAKVWPMVFSNFRCLRKK